jgi:hypothetical protein
MRDGNHNLKISLKTLSGFEYKPEVKNKSGSKLTVMDDNGNILHEGEFKSFTANFMRLLYGNMVGAGSVSAKNLVNADTDIDSYPNVKMKFAGGSGKQKFGICVGTGTDAVTNSDYNLTWESGLTYGNVVAGAVSVIGSAITVEFSREISNSSGSTKTLYEAGLICGAEDDVEDNILIARDLVSVELLNGKKSTWRYTITVDFDGTTGGFVRNFLDSLIIQWTQATASASFSTRSNHTSVVFDNKMWVIGGTNGLYLNDVWYSSDGATWTQATASASFSGRYAHTSVVFDNKMWVIGGYNGSLRLNDVWYSSDGATWTQATASASFSGRHAHTSVVFDNKMWVIGGYNGSSDLNDVWYSSDGATWTQATASASFSIRQYHTSVVFDNKMWVIGGYNSSLYHSDVWYSSDGANWTQATPSASFSGRRGHTSVVFDNKMWVIGGYNGSSDLNDVWYSSYGATWTQATASASFSIRRAHTSVVFDNKMWVIGGYNSSLYHSDVWYYGKQLDASALITDDTRGILVGSSDASFDETDTALTTKIEHGTGAGQLEYGVMPYTTDTVEPFIDGDKTLMTLARRFENNSGSSVTIKEVGIVTARGTLLCRFVPSAPIVVENGASEIITILFETEV